MNKHPILNKKNSTLQDALNRSQRELNVLYEVSKAMQTSLELNHILHTILTGVTAHTGLGFNRAILFLINPQTRALEPQMAIGPESGKHAYEIWHHLTKNNPHLDDLIQEEKIQNMNQSSLYQSIKDIKIPLKNSKEKSNLLMDAYHHGQPVHISPDKINHYINDPFLKIFKTNELILMPLKVKGKVNGLIVADNFYTQKSITPEDLKIFIMLANQAGLAIANARLYEKIKHKSHTDSLTKVWNHGFFQDQLGLEIENSKKSKNPLCLIILDIDDFKKVNDTYGHHKGDIILKELARILKDSSRIHDYVCRYGGEEFSIILTQTNKKQGLTIAERIRENIEQHTFSKVSQTNNLKVTVSVGIASIPDDASSKEDIIAESDRAMYKAKFSGKNQVFPA